MKLATCLVTCLSLAFVTTSPTPVPRDVASTTKPAWPVLKRALHGWNPHDPLSKRARGTAEAGPHEEEAAPLMSGDGHSGHGHAGHGHGDEQWTPVPLHQAESSTARVPSAHCGGTAACGAGASAGRSGEPRPMGPGTYYTGPAQLVQIYPGPPRSTFDIEHAGMTAEEKTKWMATSPFQWHHDDVTKAWVRESNVHKQFAVKKRVCDQLSAQGCKRALIQIDRIPRGVIDEQAWFPQHPVLHEMDPPILGSTTAAITPWGSLAVPPAAGHVVQLQPASQQRMYQSPASVIPWHHFLNHLVPQADPLHPGGHQTAGTPTSSRIPWADLYVKPSKGFTAVHPDGKPRTDHVTVEGVLPWGPVYADQAAAGLRLRPRPGHGEVHGKGKEPMDGPSSTPSSPGSTASSPRS